MRKHSIHTQLARRILILDGGLGTLVQEFGLGEEDFRGDIFANWELPLKGCNDLLVLTRPRIIADIHRRYLEAGADIISTDTFNSNAVSLADYGLQDWAYRISRAAAELARTEADKFTKADPSQPRYVTGSVGPTNKTASIAVDMANTARREISFEQLVEAYSPQIEGLIDGGVDIIQFETFFDTLNCKAAIFAAEEIFEKKGIKIPIIVSGTLTNSGRTLSGQTVEAFYSSVVHADPLAVGFNCSFGARQLLPFLKSLSEISDFPVSVYPNAGLPNISGGYDETPAMMAADVEEYMKLGLINIIGGCCGTTPAHIGEIARISKNYSPRIIGNRQHYTVLAGLETLVVNENTNFINIGERANVAGSAKFARLIREQKFDEALSIARNQIEGGSAIIDICFDDGMIDGVPTMERFLNMAAAEPEIARVPFMIDSSSWDVLEAGMRCVQGKCIVNSISLKEGEGEFLRRARLIRRYGAAAVVMLFDERGQADTYARKIEVAARAYGLLTENGFPPEDIVFDPNILAVATGIESHNSYAKDFIEACRWIKRNLPGVNISGGVSNLSFAFRGLDDVRRAMHSVFLYHAIGAGMNMGIVNPAMIVAYEDIEPGLRSMVEDVILARDPAAPDRLAAYAEQAKANAEQAKAGKGAASAAGILSSTPSSSAATQAQAAQWRAGLPAERISHAMLKGIADYIEADALEAYNERGSALSVIDDMFMPAMERVGELFGQGKMFLPQVVKTARVMKKGVGALLPLMEAGQASELSGGEKILIATVKGDVHDIGKNIVSVVMACNGYRIKDLGVMVDSDTIVDAAMEWGADAIGLSALITPSLDEMIKVVKELRRRGAAIPVIVGGATTSGVHTAVKIAPEYDGPVIHSRDASENIVVLNKLFGPGREEFLQELRARQESLRAAHYASRQGSGLKSLAEARAAHHVKTEADIVPPRQVGIEVFSDFPIERVIDYIDWSYFFASWSIKGSYPALLDSPEKGPQARRLLDDAKRLLGLITAEKSLTLNGVVGIFPARRHGDDIIVTSQSGEPVRLPQLRSQAPGQGENLSLADYVAGADDYIGAFALSAGIGLEKIVAHYRDHGDDYNAIMAKLLADRLTEALGEVLHEEVRRRLWGYEQGPRASAEDVLAGRYQGLRMAFGYPASPDHSLKREVFDLLEAPRNTGLRLNDSYMIEPGESLCGLMFADRQIRYFDVGRIDGEQLSDYAARRGMDVETVKKLLPRNL